MGITGPKLCTEKITSALSCTTRIVMVVPKIGVLACVVNVLGQQHHHQLPIATQHQILVLELDGDLHARQPILEAGHHFFDQRPTPTGAT